MCDPPRKWIRLTASIVSGMTWSMSPCISHSNPSRMPMTSMPFELRADGRRADDAVDAWGGAAADEDGEVLMVFHAFDDTTLGCARGTRRRSPRSKADRPKAAEGYNSATQATFVQESS